MGTALVHVLTPVVGWDRLPDHCARALIDERPFTLDTEIMDNPAATAGEALTNWQPVLEQPIGAT